MIADSNCFKFSGYSRGGCVPMFDRVLWREVMIGKLVCADVQRVP